MKMLSIALMGLLLFSEAAWGGDLTDNLDGTVTDSVTGLMWQQGENPTTVWDEAILMCEQTVNAGGYTDWRLPNVRELASLSDKSLFPSIDTVAFPGVYLLGNYWTSTTNPHYGGAFVVGAKEGWVSQDIKAFPFSYTRCVRGGNGAS